MCWSLIELVTSKSYYPLSVNTDNLYVVLLCLALRRTGALWYVLVHVDVWWKVINSKQLIKILGKHNAPTNMPKSQARTYIIHVMQSSKYRQSSNITSHIYSLTITCISDENCEVVAVIKNTPATLKIPLADRFITNMRKHNLGFKVCHDT